MARIRDAHIEQVSDDEEEEVLAVQVVHMVQESAEEEESEGATPPRKRTRPSGSVSTKEKSSTRRKRPAEKRPAEPRAKPAKGASKTASSGKVENDLWSTLDFIWPPSERPPGQLQDREWVNSQTYEKISMMKKESRNMKLTTPPPPP